MLIKADSLSATTHAHISMCFFVAVSPLFVPQAAANNPQSCPCNGSRVTPINPNYPIAQTLGVPLVGTTDGEKSGISLNRSLFVLREVMFALPTGFVGLTREMQWDFPAREDPGVGFLPFPLQRRHPRVVKPLCPWSPRTRRCVCSRRAFLVLLLEAPLASRCL